ncbi:hypothetical protein PhCBS80983_g00645 [Powellomyces hirtus]|uniref:Arf-GAP domain-containing protein n=1 Tax=Powellomyces hirtus TaxID=109895 RepID=A0A507EFU3_9FUNG|nr:hypothetical protein PhCBS80983_g00645 [Powellomyces hirtus]
MSTRHERMSDKAGAERNARLLKELMMRPDNRRCSDCRKKDPRWASWNIGVFFCIRCSGFHRSMGTHISKVKSADLDSWTEEQIQNMARWGNAKAAQYWEHDLPANFTPPENTIDQFIRAKYERKQYAMKGPIPDPDTLKGDESSANVASSATSAPHRTSPPMARLTKQGSATASAPPQAQFATFAAPGAPAATPAPANPPAQSAADQLFEVFSGAPQSQQSQTTQQSQQQQQQPGALKNSILSLYGNAPTSTGSPVNAMPGGGFGSFAAFASPSPYQQPPQQQQQQPPQLGSFGSSASQSQFPSSFNAFASSPSQYTQNANSALNGFGGSIMPAMQPALSPMQPQLNTAKPSADKGGGGIPDFAGFGGATAAAQPPVADKATDDWGAFH